MTIDATEIGLEETESKGRYIYRLGDDVAEMTFSKAGASLIIIDHTEVPGVSAARGLVRRWWRAGSPTPALAARRSFHSARSQRRSSAGIRSGPTCCSRGKADA